MNFIIITNDEILEGISSSMRDIIIIVLVFIVPFHRNFNSILRRDHQKLSYKCRAYESVDEKVMSQERRKKRIWSITG